MFGSATRTSRFGRIPLLPLQAVVRAPDCFCLLPTPANARYKRNGVTATKAPVQKGAERRVAPLPVPLPSGLPNNTPPSSQRPSGKLAAAFPGRSAQRRARGWVGSAELPGPALPACSRAARLKLEAARGGAVGGESRAFASASPSSPRRSGRGLRPSPPPACWRFGQRRAPRADDQDGPATSAFPSRRASSSRELIPIRTLMNY